MHLSTKNNHPCKNHNYPSRKENIFKSTNRNWHESGHIFLLCKFRVDGELYNVTMIIHNLHYLYLFKWGPLYFFTYFSDHIHIQLILTIITEASESTRKHNRQRLPT